MSEREKDRLIRESREKGELLDAILDGLSEGVMATDLEGRVLFANPAARKMLGMTGERVKELDEPQELPDPFEDFDLSKAVARCAAGHGCVEAAVRTRREKASLRIKLTRLEKFDDHRGGMLVMVRDLSERQGLEAAQQRFLSVAAHELKTPLTAILGSAGLLRDEEDHDVKRRFLGHIENEARRACDLADTLLSVARMGHDQRNPRPAEVDLLQAVRRAAERIGPLARGAGVELRVEGEGGRARADREWLDQVLLAILDNAVKYSDRGSGVSLRAERSTIVVADEGSGISKAHLPSVFEPFHRDDVRGTRRSRRGSGLGLFVVRDLLERMGGTISVESEEGAGTTAVIRLLEA